MATVLLLLLAIAFPLANAATPCAIKWKKPTPLKTLTVPVGTTCTWTWSDTLSHCVQFKRPNPDSVKGSVTTSGMGYKYSHTFLHPGLYKVDCCVHQLLMAVHINVTPAKRKALETPKVCKSSCNAKCYGEDGCGNSCPLPQKKTVSSCKACCSFGRKPVGPAVSSCIRKCISSSKTDALA